MSRELGGQVRTALGQDPAQPSGDVWETATTIPRPAEAPECAWCPLCRAARIVREAEPTRDTRVAAVGDAVTTVVQDAVSVLEAALAATSRGGAAADGTGLPRPGPGTPWLPRGRLGDAAGTAPVGRPRMRQRRRRRRGQAAPARKAGTADAGGQAGPGPRRPARRRPG